MSLSKAIGTLTTPGSTGNQAITGVGFQPKVVIFYKLGATAANAQWQFGVAVSSTQRWCSAAADYDALATSETARAFRSNACIISLATSDTINRQADFVSMDADGFTVNWSIAAAGQDINWLALGGSDIDVAAGTFDLTTGTGNQAITGVGFTPKALLFSNTISNTTEGVTAFGLFNMGVAVSTSQRWATGYYAEDAAAISDTGSVLLTNACLVRNSSTTISTQADFVSHDADGFTINKSIAPGASIRFGWLAFGGTARFAASTFNQPGSTGEQAVTGVGFQPDLELFAGHGKTASSSVTANARNLFGAAISSSAQSVGFDSSEDNNTTTNTSRYRSTASCIVHTADGGTTATTAATFVSQDVDGFTVNWTAADATARQIAYLAIGAASTPATATYISGPARGLSAVASTNFTAGANGDITGTVTVTPSDGGAGGTFTPSSVAISAGTPTGTFTYTPAAPGPVTITASNNGGLTAGTANYKSDSLNYYISATGSDSANGATTGTPWQTAAQILIWGWVRGATYHFNGGDTFVCELTLADSVSGTLAASLITLTSYGTGKAILARTGSSSAHPIKVTNCGGIKVDNVIIVGAGSTPAASDQYGIWVSLDSASAGTIYNITVEDCEIYNLARPIYIRGELANALKLDTVTIRNNVLHDFWYRGINIGNTYLCASNGVDAGLNFLVEGNEIYDADGYVGAFDITAIAISCSTDALIQYNLVHDMGGGSTGNGMYCWSANEGTIFQFNEIYNIHYGSTYAGDAGGINLDSGSQNCIVQYNYVHDIDGAGLYAYAYDLAGGKPAGVLDWRNNEYRYNVIQNCAQVTGGSFTVYGNDLSGGRVYNNTFVQSSIAAGVAIIKYSTVYLATNVGTFTYYNNIFLAATNSVVFIDMPSGSGVQASAYFKNNVYYPDTGTAQIKWFGVNYNTVSAWVTAATNKDTGAVTSDPALVDPFTAVIFDNPNIIGTLTKVTPLSGSSPCVDAGLDLSTAPYNYIGITRDFVGNLVPALGGYDIGAVEYGSSTGNNSRPRWLLLFFLG